MVRWRCSCAARSREHLVDAVLREGDRERRATVAACSASARWTAVSCACRRAQNASGDGAGRNVKQSRSAGAARRRATSARVACANQSSSSSSPGPEPTARAGGCVAGRAPAVATMSRRPPVHAADVRDQVADTSIRSPGPARPSRPRRPRRPARPVGLEIAMCCDIHRLGMHHVRRAGASSRGCPGAARSAGRAAARAAAW